MGPLDDFGYFRTLTRPRRISTYGISYSVIQPGHSQTLNNSINGSRKIQPAMNKPTNGCGEFNRVNDPNFQDARVAVGGSCNTLLVSLGNPLLLQSNTQQTKHSGAFGNQSSLSTSLLDLYSFKAKSANLEDFKGDISNVGLNDYIIVNMDYATKQQWGDSRHDYNGNTNHSFS
ncbi:two-component response regulator ARR18-like [Gossypium australe]|uniref:Two-component response regulator ARR18-like n=1 Tax=Gossypium australe TaxID=47621 RepID=A0A5B6WT46_9ROSI|nr:two-component response regulator ARR18-like [Gossypium australe]